MKLRIEKKTVRIRLSKEEILTLQSEGFLENRVAISEDNYLSYVVEILKDIETCDLNFSANAVEVGIPYDTAEKWIRSNQVGIKEIIDTDNGESVTLLIEEDLPPRKSAG
jgi:hypothetical protein